MYLSVGLPNPVLRMSRLSRELQGTQAGQQVTQLNNFYPLFPSPNAS